MITKEALEERYATLSNSELMDISESKYSYTELAVIVALQELSRRNINEDDVKFYEEQKIKEIKNFIAKNIIDDLSFFQKIIFFFLWLPFLNFMFKRSFLDNGYILKLKQANYYSWFGFVFCLLNIMALSKINYSDFMFWAIWVLSFSIAYYYDENFNRNIQIRKLYYIYSAQKETLKVNNDEDIQL